MEHLLFYAFAGVAVVASLLVIGQRNPMYSVLSLIASFGGLAGLYVLLGSPFVAVMQIIIYAGAIMVLFLFVVMLLNVQREESAAAMRAYAAAGPRKFGAVLASALALELMWALSQLRIGTGVPGGSVSSVRLIGRRLFTEYAFAFEVTSILILAAMLGAVVLARGEEKD